jgi:segregation and condensation protein B
MIEDRLNQLEALLYSQGGDMYISSVTDALDVTAEDVERIVADYNNSNRGLSIISDGKLLSLRTAVSQSDLIDSYNNSNARSNLSKASIEALSIILYKGEATSGEVDYIRGVSSAYTLRQLTMRGLLHKSKIGATHKYTPTAETLSILGITDIDALPGRDDILSKLDNLNTQQDKDSE